jgi:hypothetical protein
MPDPRSAVREIDSSDPASRLKFHASNQMAARDDVVSMDAPRSMLHELEVQSAPV